MKQPVLSFRGDGLYYFLNDQSDDFDGEWQDLSNVVRGKIQIDDLEIDGKIQVYITLQDDKPADNVDGFKSYEFDGNDDSIQDISDAFPCKWLKIKKVKGATPAITNVISRVMNR